MNNKKKISKPVLVICFAFLILTAYFLGHTDGKTNGKIELCEEIDGFLGMNKKTNSMKCYNASILDVPENEPLNLGGNYGD